MTETLNVKGAKALIWSFNTKYPAIKHICDKQNLLYIRRKGTKI